MRTVSIFPSKKRLSFCFRSAYPTCFSLHFLLSYSLLLPFIRRALAFFLSLSQLSSGSSVVRQLYGCNLTPLFSHLTLDSLGENITCRAYSWAGSWLLSHTWVFFSLMTEQMQLKENGEFWMERAWCGLADGFFSVKGSKMADKWMPFIDLVSVRYFLFPSLLECFPYADHNHRHVCSAVIS